MAIRKEPPSLHNIAVCCESCIRGGNSMKDKWHGSRTMLERSRKALAGGVSSPFRAKAPVPLFFEDGKGARLRDVDGNEYIDYQLAWGPMILGYSHPAMVARLRAQ